jgi:hypothetical protein
MDSEQSILIPAVFFHQNDTFRESKKLFYDWSSSEALCAFFSVIGILSATIDYEYTYHDSRTNSNCKIKSMPLDPFKIIVLITTLVALFYLLLGRYHKIMWIAYMNHAYSGIPMREITFKSYISSFKWYRLVEIIMLLIIPYPRMNFDLYLPLRYQFEMHTLCYKASEIAYLIMFLRIEIVLRAISLFSPYEDHLARTYCRRYKVPADARFGIKCLIAQYPLYVIICSAMAGMILLATIFRILERPMDNLTTYYYSDYSNALWFLFENMSTLGYGEYLPVSDFGRVVSVLGYFIGTSLFSLMVLTMQEKISLNIPQSKAFTKIYKSNVASEAIAAGIRFFLAKKKFGKFSHQAKEKKKKLRRICKEMKNKRVEVEELSKGNDEAVIDMKMNVSNIELKMKKVEKVIDVMIAQLKEDVREMEGRKL